MVTAQRDCRTLLHLLMVDERTNQLLLNIYVGARQWYCPSLRVQQAGFENIEASGLIGLFGKAAARGSRVSVVAGEDPLVRQDSL